ncbi:hypothetical protein GCM10018966_019820 [Streptomyces yanii]
MGFPYGMLDQAGSTTSTGKKFDQTVASVAPPRPTTLTSGKAAFIRSGEWTGIQSPLMKIRRRDRETISLAPSPSVGRKGASCIRAAGAESQKVMGSSARWPSRFAGSWMSSPVATRIDPPAASTPKTS